MGSGPAGAGRRPRRRGGRFAGAGPGDLAARLRAPGGSGHSGPATISDRCGPARPGVGGSDRQLSLEGRRGGRHRGRHRDRIRGAGDRRAGCRGTGSVRGRVRSARPPVHVHAGHPGPERVGRPNDPGDGSRGIGGDRSGLSGCSVLPFLPRDGGRPPRRRRRDDLQREADARPPSTARGTTVRSCIG